VIVPCANQAGKHRPTKDTDQPTSRLTFKKRTSKQHKFSMATPFKGWCVQFGEIRADAKSSCNYPPGYLSKPLPVVSRVAKISECVGYEEGTGKMTRRGLLQAWSRSGSGGVLPEGGAAALVTVRPDIYEALGVKHVINATGT